MSIDIVNLIEKTPLTKLSGNYQSAMIERVRTNFTTYEQQMFISSFYCYLNYDDKTDFVIDLDNKDPADMGFALFTNKIQQSQPFTFSSLLNLKLSL